MTEKPFCASSAEAQMMSDEEFWERVYEWRDEGLDEFAYVDPPCLYAGTCLRCGEVMTAENYEGLRSMLDDGGDFCDDCASETEPDHEFDPWDVIGY